MVMVLEQLADDEVVSQAMQEFDNTYANSNDYDRWLDKRNYKYAISFGDRLYPPKYILAQAARCNVRHLFGGKSTNTKLEQLGFNIIQKPG